MSSGPTPPVDLGVAIAAARIHRSSTAEQAADIVRNLIIGGEIPAGQPLRELHLAQAIGVSRNTMRESLRILSREGLISQDRHHIATVAEIRAADVREIFAVRRLLECGAVEMLHALDGPPELDAMRAAYDRLRLFRDEEPWLHVIEADRDFHLALVTAARNLRLLAVYERLESEIRLCLALTTRVEVSIEQIALEHRTLLDHLERGEFAAVVAYLGETMDGACERVCRVLEAGGRPGAGQSEPEPA